MPPGASSFQLVGPDEVESWLSTLRSGECLTERSLRRLCRSASELLMEESNVQPVLSPVTIVGDLHGQFYDLLNLLSPEVGGEPPNTSYVFLGDFVDRGHNSVETLSLLLCLKLKYPGHVTLLRGNHEVNHITSFTTIYTPHHRRLRRSRLSSSLSPYLSLFLPFVSPTFFSQTRLTSPPSLTHTHPLIPITPSPSPLPRQ
jgi:hypothetical protein